MSENIPPTPPGSSDFPPGTPVDPNVPPGRQPPRPPAAQQPGPKKKKKHWILRTVGVLLLLLILLVVFAPTLASLGFVKSIVISQVNSNLNGSVEVGGYSAGWFSGVNANDVKVYDAQKNLILEMKKFSTDLSLLDAARGDLKLGNTVVDVDLTRAVIGKDGKLNYAGLSKSSAAKPKAESTSSPRSSASSLPNLTGKLTVNYKGSVYLEGTEKPLVTIQPSTAIIDIPNINQPVSNDVTLKYAAAGGPVGAIHLAGTASAVKNNQLDVKDATADEKLDLSDVDLKALNAVLQIVAPALHLQTAGTASGSLAVKAAGLDSLAANGEIKVAKLDVSGEPLKGGDRVQVNDISIPVDLARTLKDGKPYLDVKHADVVLNGGQLGKVTVTASGPQDALIQAAAMVPAVAQRSLMGKPTSPDQLTVTGDGNAKITADLDVAALADQLKNTISLQKGTALTQGHLSHVTTIVLSNDAAKIDTDTKLPDLKGTTDGRPVALSPIDVSAGLNTVGGASPDLRDLSLNFSSGFLNAKGGGATLSQEKLSGSFDLAKLQAEASQFVDLDALVNPPSKTATTAPAVPPHVQLAGTGSFELSTNGDLIKDGGSAKTNVNLNVAGINASGVGTLPPVQLDALTANISGDLQRGAGTGPFVTGYKNVLVTLVSTAGNAPVLDLAAAADLTLPIVTAPKFELTRLKVPDLNKVQQQFGAFVPTLAAMGINITGGQIAASTAGSYDGKTLTLSKPFTLSASNISLTRTDPKTKTISTILSNESVQMNANGTFGLPDKSTGSGGSAKLTDLSVTSSSGLFGVTKAPNADFTVALDKGAVKGNGGLTVSADLKKLNDLAQHLAPPTTNPTAGQLQGGKLDGTLTLAHGDTPETHIDFAGQITGLTVTTLQKPIENETIHLALKALSRDDFSGMSANASLDSRFLAARLLNAGVFLPTAGKPVGVFDMLKHAELEVNVPDLPAVYGIINAFSPPAAAALTPLTDTPAGALADARTDAAPILLAVLDPSVAPGSLPDSLPGETPEETLRRHKRDKAARAARQAAAGVHVSAKTPAAANEKPAEPLLPLQLLSGTASMKAVVDRDTANQTTALTVSDLRISKLALARGETSHYAFAKDLTFKLAAAVKTSSDKAATQPIQQIQQVRVTQLDGDLGVSKLSMPQPIVLTNIADLTNAEATGAIKLDGSLDDATPLLAVLQGSPKKLPYGGAYAVSQTIGTAAAAQGKVLRLGGTVDVADFKVLDDDGKTAFVEPKVNVKDDLDYIVGKTDPKNGSKEFDQAIVRALAVDMPSSQALSMNFSGRVIDPMVRRTIKGAGGAETAKLDVNYDLAKLWPIIKPMLSADVQEKYANLKIAGKEQKTFTLSGAFPAAKTVAQSLHHLNADGGIALEELDLPQGINVSKFDLPFTMKNGVLVTLAGQGQEASAGTGAYATTQKVIAKTAVANDGAVDLSEVTVDLGQAALPVTIAPSHKLLQGIRLNPVLANSLGSANVLFKSATAATGLVDVTVVECNEVALGDLVALRPKSSATIAYSVSDLSIDGPAPTVLSSVLGLGGQGLHGAIKDGKLTLANGEVNNDFALDIVRYKKPTAGAAQATSSNDTQTFPNAVDDQGNRLVPVEMPLKFSGGVALASGALKNFAVNIPSPLLDPVLKNIDKNLVGAFPEGAVIPFSGSNGNLTLDLARFVQENAAKGLFNKVIGGNADNPAAGLGDLLKKKKKKPANDGSGG